MTLYNEIEPYAAAWLKNLVAVGRIADGVVDDRSIKDLAAADLSGHEQAHFFAGLGGWSAALRLADWPDDVPVWTGSCPCQPFSAAGRRNAFADERHLWPAWFSLIQQCRPPVIFGEQVASPDALKWLDVVHADVEGAGYAFGAAILPAASVGAPHIRHRIYWVAHTDSARLEGLHKTRRRIDLQSAEALVRGHWEAEPAVARVADGLRNGGVGQIRAFGNAIVPPLAAVFIRAFIESLADRLALHACPRHA